MYSYVDEPILENQSCFQGEGRGGGEVGEGERQREALADENQDCYRTGGAHYCHSSSPQSNSMINLIL